MRARGARRQNARTALMIAAIRGHADCVSLLVSAGAALEAADNDHRTALYFAAQQGQAAATQRLLRAGARSQIKDRRARTPPASPLRGSSLARAFASPLDAVCPASASPSSTGSPRCTGRPSGGSSRRSSPSSAPGATPSTETRRAGGRPLSAPTVRACLKTHPPSPAQLGATPFCYAAAYQHLGLLGPMLAYNGARGRRAPREAPPPPPLPPKRTLRGA